MYHFEKGRKNKQLCHGNGCKWGTRKKLRKGGSNQQHQSLSHKRKHDAPAKCTEKVSSPMPTRFSGGTSTRPRTPQGSNQTTSSNSQGSSDTSKQSAAAAAMTHQGPFEVGTLVFIQDRSGPGCNDVGGVAKVIHVHEPTESSARLYDVHYVIEHRRMRGIEEKYVTLHTDYVSPMKDTGANNESEKAENIQANENNADVAENANDEPANEAEEAASVDEQEVGEDGHPLSDYERLRLRNIQRNNARLEQLGLLHEDNKLKPAKDSIDLSSTKKQKKKKQQQPSEAQWLERRTWPKRQTSQRSEEDGVGEKPKSTASSTANTVNKAKATLEDAAKLGCKKCIDELQSGQKKKTRHSTNCPLKPSNIDSGSVAVGSEKLTKGPTNKSDAIDASLATLTDAAKAGCKKCTLEWQTDKADPAVNHDVCCPRAQKKGRYPMPSTQDRTKQASTISQGGPPAQSNTASTLARSESKASTHSCRIRQPTPSPVFGRNNNGYPPQLPAWINEFIDESNRHNETVPAPHGSKWLPCPNPWGKIGHEEGDFVVISPFQSESEADMLSIFQQGPNGSMPKRFVANPFEAGSPYHASHKSPARGEGYSVLKLTRDSSGLRPWGFTVRLHEFGGACLVDSVEPLSSAEAAEDISGWSNDCNGSSKTSLTLHDMLICVNGKSVGSMTMPELQIELDVCGPQLMLVVSRFEIQENESNNQGECATLEDIAMDWNDIGAGCDDARKRKRVSFEEESSKENYEVKGYTNMNNAETEESQLKYNNEEYEESRDYSQNGLQKPSIMSKGRKSTTLPSSNKSARINASLGLKASHSQYSKSGYENGQTAPNDINPDDSSCRGGKKLEKGGASGKEKDKPKENAIEVGRQSIQNRHTIEKESKHAGGTHKASKATHLKSTVGAKIKSRYQKQLEDLSDDESNIVQKRAPAKKNKAESSSTIAQAQKSHDFACSSDVDDCEGADDDENPWLGCVCGKTHPHPIKVFWIQCEGCDAWYNVAQECVGFDAKVAEKLEEWCCWTCDPPVAGLGL